VIGSDRPESSVGWRMVGGCGWPGKRHRAGSHYKPQGSCHTRWLACGPAWKQQAMHGGRGPDEQAGVEQRADQHLPGPAAQGSKPRSAWQQDTRLVVRQQDQGASKQARVGGWAQLDNLNGRYLSRSAWEASINWPTKVDLASD